MRQTERRDGLPAQELGRLHPAMAGHDLVIVADEHRVGEAKALDAGGDLADLLLGMCSGIARIRTQAGNRQQFDFHGMHGLKFSDDEDSRCPMRAVMSGARGRTLGLRAARSARARVQEFSKVQTNGERACAHQPPGIKKRPAAEGSERMSEQ